MSDEPKLLEPARTVIEKLGGAENAAKAAKITTRRVLRWGTPKNKGGTDGLIPTRRQQPMLDWAREHGKNLSPEDFFVGRSRQGCADNDHSRGVVANLYAFEH